MPSTKEVSPVFKYGKYKGESMHEIAETDPDYVIWVAEHSISENVPQQLYLNLVLAQQDLDGDYEDPLADFTDLWDHH